MRKVFIINNKEIGEPNELYEATPKDSKAMWDIINQVGEVKISAKEITEKEFKKAVKLGEEMA